MQLAEGLESTPLESSLQPIEVERRDVRFLHLQPGSKLRVGRRTLELGLQQRFRFILLAKHGEGDKELGGHPIAPDLDSVYRGGKRRDVGQRALHPLIAPPAGPGWNQAELADLLSPDVELRHALWTFVRRLNRDGHTVVLTTHYLEEAQQRRQHLPGLGALVQHIGPHEPRAQLQRGADADHRIGNIERSRDHLVQRGRLARAQHAIHGGQQLREGQRKRRLRRRGGRRQVRPPEAIATLLAAPLEMVDHLADLLVLQQATHQLAARVLPLLVVTAPYDTPCHDDAARILVDAVPRARHAELSGGARADW